MTLSFSKLFFSQYFFSRPKRRSQDSICEFDFKVFLDFTQTARGVWGLCNGFDGDYRLNLLSQGKKGDLPRQPGVSGAFVTAPTGITALTCFPKAREGERLGRELNPRPLATKSLLLKIEGKKINVSQNRRLRKSIHLQIEGKNHYVLK